MEHSHNHEEKGNGQSWLFSRTGVATLVAVSVLGFLIYEGHGMHLLGYAPFLLILACPLMHGFMHGGHGGHGGHQHGSNDMEENATRPPEAQQAAGAQQPGNMPQNSQQANNNTQQHQHKGGCH